MASLRMRLASCTALALFSIATPALAQDDFELDTIILTAEEQIKQALGVSTITAEDIERQPVVNDVAQIIRQMPGVNLSGTSSSGQRGNQRQIDIRGMGPENVLILIDGKPVLSRTAVKQGRAGERDTRGDTNWVPAEMVERIEVIRGPAAARYGSGAAGGVVNIITKAPDENLLQLSMKYDRPQSDLEGPTQRYNLLWAKRLNDDVALRFTGSYNRTEADDASINEATSTCTTDATTGTETCTATSAGSEGVVNKDATLLLSFTPNAADKFDLEFGISRQGNLYAGDTQLSGQLGDSGDSLINQLADEGAETNVMTRKTAALTHHGDYSWGSIMSYVQYENTENHRLAEGTTGGVEGTISTSSSWDTAVLEAVSGKTEVYLDNMYGSIPSALTLGAEVRWEKLDLSEYSSFATLTATDGSYDSTDGDPVTEQLNIGLYVEDNIELTERLTLTPAARADWADSYGVNMSGGVNAAYKLTDTWTVKGGVAKAFKSPTLYQLSETYIYSTSGNGCPYPYYRLGPCYVLGNEDLKPETSVNSEIGVSYQGKNGLQATLTYFDNDYRDKIQSGLEQIGTVAVTDRWGAAASGRLYQWENIPESRVAGFEGSFAYMLNDDFTLRANGTYMSLSEQTLELEDGSSVKVPLSLVPEYTINASVDWRASDKLTVTPSLTHYGEIDATEYSATTGYAEDTTDSVDPYTIYNIAVGYKFDNGLDLSAGITNLFDKEVLRSNEGASTYNEPGRAFYIGVTKTF